MLQRLTIKTQSEGFTDITEIVRRAVADSGVRSGLCVVFSPHTTAGITINENADPDVVHDILFALDRAFPDRTDFRHAEGNSAAHVKAGFVGSSATVIVEDGQLMLGRWQGVYFCEFDGPRTRTYYIKFVSEN